MSVVLISVAVLFCVVVSLLVVIDYVYYDKKLPKESLEEINRIIAEYEDNIKATTNMVIISELSDMKEYWEYQRKKVLKHLNNGK